MFVFLRSVTPLRGGNVAGSERGKGVGPHSAFLSLLLRLSPAFSRLSSVLSSFPPPCLQKRRRGPPLPVRQEKRPRINQEIRAEQVLLVDETGAKTITVAEALRLAQEQELDLIEVSPKAVPPVVKIANFGQYLYQLRKKERKQRVHSKQTEVKMLRFGFRTDKHDLDRLVDRAREFLAERHLVKFVVRLRGRELSNKDYAKTKLLSLVEQLKDVTEVEQELKQQGPQFFVILRGKH